MELYLQFPISLREVVLNYRYVGVLVSLWLFLFASQPKEFFLGGLKKLEQRSHKCVELRGEYVNTFFKSVACFLYKAKDLSAPTRMSFALYFTFVLCHR
jgi:hypothetical protein